LRTDHRLYQNETMKFYFDPRFPIRSPAAGSQTLGIRDFSRLGTLARRMLLWLLEQSISERRKDSEMARKPGKSSPRKVKNLRLKTLSSEKAKQVKGGPINWPNGPQEAGRTSLLLPAVQKVRE
jgi:hypothetical protein